MVLRSAPSITLTYSRFRDQEAQWEQTVDVLRGNMET